MSKNLLLIIRKLCTKIEASHDISIVDDLDSIICTGYELYEKCLSALKTSCQTNAGLSSFKNSNKTQVFRVRREKKFM